MNSYRVVETVWWVFIVFFVLAIVYGVTGCSTYTPCIKPVVSIERPILPTISASELQPLADDVYIRLVTRDRLMHEYAEQLETIVQEVTQ